MRTLYRILTILALATASTATIFSSSYAIARPAVAPSFAGSWKGGLLGSVFTFEFRQASNGWTGRYTSEKSGKWADLHDVTVADGVVRFNFKSQPPSKFSLTIDATGKTLDGTATFGDHPALPLTLTRVS